MSDAAGLNVGAVIDERLAARFRELCRKELLGERDRRMTVERAAEHIWERFIEPRQGR